MVFKYLQRVNISFCSSGSAPRHSLRLSFTPEKLAGLNEILLKRRLFSPEDIRNIATYFKLQESKCRIWFKENGARLRRQACSVRILPDPKRSSSDRRKSYILKVRKRSSGVNPNPPAGKGEKLRKHDDAASSSVEADATTTVCKVEENNLNTDEPENDVDAATSASEETSDKHEAGMKLIFSDREASSDTDSENNSVAASAIKQEPKEANLSGSDESKNSVFPSGDSRIVLSGLGVRRTRNKFFYELPFDKQILLLKRTQNLTSARSADAQKLAAELEAPFKSVYGWLKSKTIRQFRTWSKRLSREKIAVLDDQFAASPDGLTEEQALLLSYELDVSVCTILKYFERKRTETKTEDDEQACSSSAKVAQNVSKPGDSEIEKPTDQSPDASIRNPLILVPQYVPSGSPKNRSSGICLRPRASSDLKNQSRTSAQSAANEKDALRKRRFVLTPRQRKLLMLHFQKTPFIVPADASTLANKLGLPVKAVQLWFHRKRMEKNQTDASEMEESDVSNATDNQTAEETPTI